MVTMGKISKRIINNYREKHDIFDSLGESFQIVVVFGIKVEKFSKDRVGQIGWQMNRIQLQLNQD